MRNNKLIYFLILAVAILLVALYFKKQRKPKGEEVTTEKVAKRTIKEMVGASGKIFPETEIKVSSDVSGEIVDLFVEEGDSVVAGQLLCKIDPDTYKSMVERSEATVNSSKAQVANSQSGVARAKAQLIQAKAQLDQIKSQVENQRNVHNRNITLHEEGVISQADFETSQAALRQLEANQKSAEANVQTAKANIESAQQSVRAAEFSVKSTQASLKEMRTSLSRTSIQAGTSGIISKLNVEKGERVVGTAQMSGTEIMRIANLNSMEVQVDVSENDVLRVSVGDEVDIEVDAYLDRKFKGKVTEIANSASNTGNSISLNTDQVTNFVVKIRIDPASYQDLIQKGKPYPFRPGMSASVDINTDTQNDVLCVPIQSVTTREDKKEDEDNEEKKKKTNEKIKEVVFVMSADTAKMVEVKTGIQDDEYIQILTGLSEGEEVISGPYSAISRKLKKGMKLRKKEKKKKE
ncbi:MAG TPA: HlyD family secretion protein [Phaeodactylibacter sp.]|nr:HlyD family secretion protein [Phaeodactylibacter sp.]